jgi:hypothetical protein
MDRRVRCISTHTWWSIRSIEPETGKSYIELEYDYAEAKEKPFFAVVITEEQLRQKVALQNLDAIERRHQDSWMHFGAE